MDLCHGSSINMRTQLTKSMTRYSIVVLVAVLAQLCSGAHQVVSTYVKHHARVMSKEIEQRVNAGVMHGLVSHQAKKLSALVPSASPTVAPTEDPSLSRTGYLYLTNSFNSDCSNPVVSVGFPINTCLKDDSLSYYKVRIVDGKPFSFIRQVACFSSDRRIPFR